MNPPIAEPPVEAAYPAGAGAFLVKNADLQLAVVDEALTIVAVNQAWRQAFAVAPAEHVGAALDTIIPRPALEGLAARGRQAGAPAISLFPVDVEGRGSCWFEAGYKRQGRQSVIAIVDVTGAVSDGGRIEAARRARDLLLEDAGVETWRYDPQADRFHFSPELATDYGLTPPVLSAEDFANLRHPADVARESAIRERIVRNGGVDEVEMRVRGFDDLGWRHVRVNMLAGPRQPSGQFEVYGHVHSVSEVARARDEARANTEFLKMALSAAQAGVFEVDHVAREFRCSPEFVQIVGRALTYDEGRQATWPELPDDDAEAMRRMQGRWGSPGHLSVDVRGGKGGRWIRFYCKVARDEAGIGLGAVGLVLDIEDAKRQELDLIAAQQAAEAATEAKSRFLASVSHEIRTPMNGIVGVLHLMKNEPISAEGQGLLTEALACSGMLSQLINDVLDISKIEAGMLELTAEASRISDAVEGVVGLLEPQAQAKGLYLRAEIADGLGWAMVDGVRLRQCLFNLIGNAVKFTPAGGVAVRMLRAGEGRVRVEVEDTGIGIADEARARLFQRFVQADDTTTRTFSGTGLGLAISRSLAQLMDGDIGFTSEEGKGSTFWLEFAAPPVDGPAHGAGAVAQASLGDLSILLVDDNATNRLVGGKILQALGAGVTMAESGAEAIELARTQAFDLVLMDVNMPGMDGVEATRHIRGLPAPAGQMPIVALTANVMAHQRRSYLEAGMNGVVPKPLSPAALLTEIMRLAGGDADEDDQAAA